MFSKIWLVTGIIANMATVFSAKNFNAGMIFSTATAFFI